MEYQKTLVDRARARAYAEGARAMQDTIVERFRGWGAAHFSAVEVAEIVRRVDFRAELRST